MVIFSQKTTFFWRMQPRDEKKYHQNPNKLVKPIAVSQKVINVELETTFGFTKTDWLSFCEG